MPRYSDRIGAAGLRVYRNPNMLLCTGYPEYTHVVRGRRGRGSFMSPDISEWMCAGAEMGSFVGENGIIGPICPSHACATVFW